MSILDNQDLDDDFDGDLQKLREARQQLEAQAQSIRDSKASIAQSIIEKSRIKTSQSFEMTDERLANLREELEKSFEMRSDGYHAPSLLFPKRVHEQIAADKELIKQMSMKKAEEEALAEMSMNDEYAAHKAGQDLKAYEAMVRER